MYNFLSEFSNIFHLQKELKHFCLEVLVIHGILEHIVLNISKYIFCYMHDSACRWFVNKKRNILKLC